MIIIKSVIDPDGNRHNKPYSYKPKMTKELQDFLNEIYAKYPTISDDTYNKTAG